MSISIETDIMYEISHNYTSYTLCIPVLTGTGENGSILAPCNCDIPTGTKIIESDSLSKFT